MAYTFLKVQGHAIGNSLFEEDFMETAESFLKNAEKAGVEVILPMDHVVASRFDENAEAEAIDSVEIPEGKLAMDVGPKTVAAVKERIAMPGQSSGTDQWAYLNLTSLPKELWKLPILLRIVPVLQ